MAKTLKTTPKAPPGSFPGQGAIDSMGPIGLRLGVITRVDELNMRADVTVITGGGDRGEIDLTQAIAGPRSFWGGVPEVNSLVVLGYRPKHKQLNDAVILGYLPVGNKTGLRFDPFAPDEPATIAPEDASLYKQVIGNTTRYKRLRLRPGDVGGMSSDGAELVLARDLRMCNRAGDLIELRDVERTLVMQSVHTFTSAAGVKKQAGPVRRGDLFFPNDIFAVNKDGTISNTLKSEGDGYYGRDEIQAAGPGVAGSSTKYANSSGVVLDNINDITHFPPVTYSNGKRVFYAATTPNANFEDGEASGGAFAFTEHRMEIAHDTDGTQEVLSEIDGFSMDHRAAYIEQVFGTVVGNDAWSAQGLRQYGKVLQPKVFDDWGSPGGGKFTLEEVDRAVWQEDTGVLTSAGAYLFRIFGPNTQAEGNPFAVAVSKQGKLFVHIPGSKVERYPSRTANVSAEVDLEGALKMFVGMDNAGRTSVKFASEGAIEAEIGKNNAGESIKLLLKGSISTTYVGNNDDFEAVKSEDISGNCVKHVRGDDVSTIDGAMHTLVNGGYVVNADNITMNGQSGFGISAGNYTATISGKAVINYALIVLETIAAGGKITTCLAGAMVTTVAAGAYTVTAGAGAVSITAGAGAVAVTSGAAMSLSAGAAASIAATGALSLTSGAAVSISAGLALNLTSAVALVVNSPQVLLGSPAAQLGVARGAPAMPPGVPTLDYITGLPLLGSSIVKAV